MCQKRNVIAKAVAIAKMATVAKMAQNKIDFDNLSLDFQPFKC